MRTNCNLFCGNNKCKQNKRKKWEECLENYSYNISWDYGEQKQFVNLIIKRCKQPQQQQFNALVMGTHVNWFLKQQLKAGIKYGNIKIKKQHYKEQTRYARFLIIFNQNFYSFPTLATTNCNALYLFTGK